MGGSGTTKEVSKSSVDWLTDDLKFFKKDLSRGHKNDIIYIERGKKYGICISR